MTGFNHALAGTCIALLVKQPLLIAPLAFLSHFLLDALPHFHHQSFGDTFKRPYSKRFKNVIIFDTIVSIVTITAVLFIWRNSVLSVAIGIFFSMLPDFTWPLHGKIKSLERFFKMHIKIQWAERPWGILVEAPFSILIVSYLFATYN